LDLSRILAGPLCTMWMADLGAEVIKVEKPGVGDETRRWGPPFVAGESAYFLAVNRGKYGIALDLAAPQGQRILRGLIEKSDIVVHNFLPQTAEQCEPSIRGLFIFRSWGSRPAHIGRNPVSMP